MNILENSMNYQRPKLNILINNIEIEGMDDTRVDVTIVHPKSWQADWPLREVHIQLQRIMTLSPVKQSSR